MELKELGKSSVMVPAMGVGTMLWTPRGSISEQTIRETYSACIDNGLNFFDTAEIYGNGASERVLGACIKKDGRPVLVATKFAPPSPMNPLTQKRTTVSKNSPQALLEALDGSLRRLGVDHIDLYQIHMPPSKSSIADYMDAMAEAVKAGKVRAVGVCNFNEAQIREAHSALAKQGIPLATAMVGYNLLRRWPETNGTFAACRELGVSVIPYAPLAEGVLTGKYRAKGKRVPLGYKVALYFGHLNITKDRQDSQSLMHRMFSKPLELDGKRLEPLFQTMGAIAAAHGKTLAQVAINWLLTNDEVRVIPIPGMKSVGQVENNIGALDWTMTTEERARFSQKEKTL
ncbi:MAG: aldo/keto reductase [Clostridiales Family XIII bacterium]|jgi:aryl-alcohol dehydrogenase-like predicted oxidoreductase|nr:aldo/keto reductase [Clostridiales Family XIII bacterium]